MSTVTKRVGRDHLINISPFTSRHIFIKLPWPIIQADNLKCFKNSGSIKKPNC